MTNLVPMVLGEVFPVSPRHLLCKDIVESLFSLHSWFFWWPSFQESFYDFSTQWEILSIKKVHFFLLLNRLIVFYWVWKFCLCQPALPSIHYWSFASVPISDQQKFLSWGWKEELKSIKDCHWSDDAKHHHLISCGG